MSLDEASAVTQIHEQIAAHIFGISILYWDHIITLGAYMFFCAIPMRCDKATADAEIHLFWPRWSSRTTHLFFLNRYFAFLGNVWVGVLPFLELSPEVFSSDSRTSSTAVGYATHRVRSVLTMSYGDLARPDEATAAVVMILRMYALYNRSAWVVSVLGSIVLLLGGLAIWAVTTQENIPPVTLRGCHIPISASSARRLAAPWQGLFLFDITVLGMTLLSGYRAHRRSPGAMPLHDLFVKDGALFFGWVALNFGVLRFPLADALQSSAIAMANLSNILTFYFGGPLFRGSLSTFASSVSATMTSRLILNLHAQGRAVFSTPSSNFQLEVYPEPNRAYARDDDIMGQDQLLNAAAMPFNELWSRMERRSGLVSASASG
ncbi:unnamed protein product [Mycena citricolor]|uniref:Uncharacterized protein n=1 Tax=Mycena citricolor TaxID=2018698 RepID=A0AAD2K835_9AGAR|nr:unnamed protein product [Mycena citricolor]